jgi:hypothetical protein
MTHSWCVSSHCGDSRLFLVKIEPSYKLGWTFISASEEGLRLIIFISVAMSCKDNRLSLAKYQSFFFNQVLQFYFLHLYIFFLCLSLLNHQYNVIICCFVSYGFAFTLLLLGDILVHIIGPLCVCICADVRNWRMTPTFPLQVSSLCSPTRHGALSYEPCIVFWMVHLHTWSRRLFLWMTAVTEVHAFSLFPNDS